MSSTQGAPAPVQSSGIVSWIRSIDIRKVAWVIGFSMLIEKGIVDGDAPLADLGLSAGVISHIVGVCKFLLWMNGIVLVGHTTSAVRWPTPAQSGGFNAKAIIALLIGVAAAFAVLQPYSAHATAVVRHRIVPMPLSRPAEAPQLPANATLDAGTTPSAATVKQNILATAPADLQYAIQLATQANTPQSGVRKMCYQAILAAIPQTSTGTTLPPGPDVVTHIEQGAELLDSLQPTSPIFVNCAGAASLAGQNVLTFVNAIVTGIAGIATLAPKIP